MSPQQIAAMKAFFEPSSVAAIGSLRVMPGTAYWLINNMREFGYSGTIYPINPDTTKYPEVLGMQVYESVAAVPGDIDLAVAIAPPTEMPKIVNQFSYTVYFFRITAVSSNQFFEKLRTENRFIESFITFLLGSHGNDAGSEEVSISFHKNEKQITNKTFLI